MLKIRPILKYQEPDYPCRDYLLEHPELLRYVPKRWRGNPLIHTFLGAALCLLNQPAAQAEDKTEKTPVLQMHIGIAGDMCAPKFLSEEEATKIIQSEAKKAGIAFTSPGEKITNLKVRYIISSDDKKLSSPVEKGLKEVTMNGLDEKKHVAFEYLSEKGIEKLDEEMKTNSSEQQFGWATLESRTAAVKTALDKAEPGVRHAVFYDPQGYDDKENRKQLEIQVREFLAYLKAQGVI